MEQADGVKIKYTCNGNDYRLPELAHFSADVACVETNTVYEIFGCFWHGHHRQPFRDVITSNGVTLAARYEQTMSRLE